MNKNDEIDDSVEFCKDIDSFYNGKNSKRNKNVNKDKKKVSRNYESAKLDITRRYQEIPLELEEELPVKEKIKVKKKVNEEEEENRIFTKEKFNFIFCVVLALIIANLIMQYVVQHTQVEGISMENTLENRDILLIDKLTYKISKPKRFDIVSFPFEKNVYYIKRIIGMPGETVQIIDSNIYINGEILEENYGKGKIEDPGLAADAVTLGKDEYFVMGDNRNNSIDSRVSSVGNIKKSKILGRAWFKIYPFHGFGKIKHE